MLENLKAIGKDYIWLKKQVQKFNINPEDALVVTIDGKNQIFCQAKEGKNTNSKTDEDKDNPFI